jgi:acyl dehydratase
MQKELLKSHLTKKTIAHGFLVLSYASQITFRTLKLNNIKLAINYGLDKVRFPNATPSDSYFRGRVSLIEFEEIPGGVKYKLNIVFEVKGETKPVCVAETLSLVYSSSEEKT